jgi:uncharacterized repeat protein (TIGR01451 family)
MQASTHRSRTFYLACTLLLFSIAVIGTPAIRSQAAQAPLAFGPYQAHALAVGATPRILLVDDDTNDPDVRAYFTTALDGLGVDYDIWDTATSDEPNSAALANYATVIWFTGLSGYPDAAAETALADFLDHGHCLFMSSQEYLYNSGSTPTAFMQNYLGVASAADDVAAITVTGVGPVFGGMGSSSLQLPYDNRTDRISPDATATLAFNGFNITGPVDSGVQKDAGAYRTMYWGFGLEGLPSAARRQGAMKRVLSWCSFQADLSLQQAVSPPVVLRPGQPLTYTLRYSNDGVAIASGVLLTDTLPALSSLSVTSSGPAIIPVAGASYRWQIADIVPGASGAITITGVVDPGLTADVDAANTATLTTSTFDSDPTNNSAQTVFDVLVPRLAFSSATYSVAEQGGTALVTVTLDAPNAFADTSVAYATNDGSALAGSDYTAHADTLTLLAGQSSASFSVSIADDAVPEGGETVLLSLSNASGALLTAPSSATLTILSNDGVTSPRITSLLPLSTTLGVAYRHQFTASGLPLPSFTLAAGALPSGLALSTDGMLSGVPTLAGSYSGISVIASNGMAPDATQTFSIVVAGASTHVYLPLVGR